MLDRRKETVLRRVLAFLSLGAAEVSIWRPDEAEGGSDALQPDL